MKKKLIKKEEKELKLDKKLITNLNQKEMEVIKGGNKSLNESLDESITISITYTVTYSWTWTW